MQSFVFKVALGAMLMAAAQSGSAQNLYKWVDEKGKVHYGDKTDLKVAPQPAQGRGAPGTAKSADPRSTGPVPGQASSPNDPQEVKLHMPARPGGSSYPSSGRDRFDTGEMSDRERYLRMERERMAEDKKRQAEQNEARRSSLIAQCERNRGVDCSNPSTQRDIENQNKPRGAYR